MISNLRISVAELVIWALLAAAGLTWILLRLVDGIERAWNWLVRDRVVEALEDKGGCNCCELDEYNGPLTIERDAECTNCGHPDLWHMAPVEVGDQPPLPPERTWEQMTSHQLPLLTPEEKFPASGWSSGYRPEDWHAAGRERRAPWWEAEQRAAYESLGLDYPSGLLARVREAGQ